MDVAPWTVIGWIVVAILILSIIITPIALYVMTQRHRPWRESIEQEWQTTRAEIRAPIRRADRPFRL